MTASKPRVLVVDDEPAILRFLRPALEANDYEVISAGTVAEAMKRIAGERPDVVVLDLGLPDGDGKDVIKSVRAWSDVPIVVLSAREREAEKIAAFDLGADDYVDKPFGVGELMARLRAALRHRLQRREETPVLRLGALEIDNVRHRVTQAGQEIKLTRKEFELLSFLARHAGKVVTHRQILSAVWGPAHTEDTQYLRVYIRQLRQKIEPNPDDPRTHRHGDRHRVPHRRRRVTQCCRPRSNEPRVGGDDAEGGGARCPGPGSRPCADVAGAAGQARSHDDRYSADRTQIALPSVPS